MSRTSRRSVSELIVKKILVIRSQRVLLDSHLAKLYGVPTRRLNEQVRRNLNKFPVDFMFRLSINELRDNRSQIATGSSKHRDPRFAPLAFTEHGAIMAATVLNSPRAVAMSVYVVRAFVKLRGLLASNDDLARKLDALEKSVESLDEKTRKQFDEVYAAIRELMRPPIPTSRPIRFTADISGK